MAAPRVPVPGSIGPNACRRRLARLVPRNARGREPWSRCPAIDRPEAGDHARSIAGPARKKGAEKTPWCSRSHEPHSTRQRDDVIRSGGADSCPTGPDLKPPCLTDSRPRTRTCRHRPRRTRPGGSTYRQVRLRAPTRVRPAAPDLCASSLRESGKYGGGRPHHCPSRPATPASVRERSDCPRAERARIPPCLPAGWPQAARGRR